MRYISRLVTHCIVAITALACCIGPVKPQAATGSKGAGNEDSRAVYLDGQLPEHLRKLDAKYKTEDFKRLHLTIVVPALEKAAKTDPISYIRKYAKEINDKRKRDELTLVYGVSFCRNDKKRPIEVMTNVQAQPAKIKDKQIGKAQECIMLFLPALDQEITTLKPGQLQDLLLAILIHEYRHIVKERIFTDDTPYPLVVASESQIWEEQIKELFPQMKRSRRYLQPGIETHIVAYHKLIVRHPSQWLSYVAKYLAHPQ